MQTWMVTTQATAEIEERWLVQAETQADAEESYGSGLFIDDVTIGEERDREVASVSMASADDIERATIDANISNAAPALLAALETILLPSPHYGATQAHRDYVEAARVAGLAAIAAAKGA